MSVILQSVIAGLVLYGLLWGLMATVGLLP